MVCHGLSFNIWCIAYLFGLPCQVFDRLSQEGRGKVTVFFCGSPALGDVLKAHSAKYNFAFRKENF